MLPRRAFLRALGLAPVAAAASATQAAGLGAGVASAFGYGVAPAVGELVTIAPVDGGTIAKRIVSYLASNSLPSYVTERIRADAQNVTRLDPDLAVNRSFSLSTKFRIQREREIERAIARSLASGPRNVSREAFRERFGFELW